MDDLGLTRARLIGFVLLPCAIPTLTAVLLGVTWSVGIGVAVAALVAFGGSAVLAARFARCKIVNPLRSIANSVGHLEDGPLDVPFDEKGLPLLHDVARKLYRATTTIISREQLSQARIVSVESAFERVHSVIQSLRDGVIVVDADDKVVLANTRARAVLGSDRQKLEGQQIGELLQGRLRETVLSGLEQIHAGTCDEVKGSCLEYEDRFFNLTVVKAVTTLPDQDFGTVVVLADITANREVTRLKETFLSGVSHELRTPLTNICSSVELLGDGLPPDKVREEWSNWPVWEEFLGVVSEESLRMKGLVDDLLEYTQIDSRGGLERKRDAVDLVPLTREVLETFEKSAKEKSVALEPRLPPEAAKAWTNGVLIRRVLGRLLDNAIKFTPRGGRVQVTVRQVGDLVEVAVADSGAGIPPEHREAVFSSFQQLGDLMTDKPKGTGLGLTICQHTLEALGGMIWCEEAELGGASFHFLLPTMPAAVPAGGVLSQ